MVRAISPPDNQFYPWIVGLRRAMEMMLTGDSISGREAVDCGFAGNRAHPTEALEAVRPRRGSEDCTRSDRRAAVQQASRASADGAHGVPRSCACRYRATGARHAGRLCARICGTSVTAASRRRCPNATLPMVTIERVAAMSESDAKDGNVLEALGDGVMLEMDGAAGRAQFSSLANRRCATRAA